MKIFDYELEQTCGACPEQYDVYKDGNKVGYLRLRHGYFRAEATITGDIVYEAHPKGDGCFYEDERALFLMNAITCLNNYLITKSINDAVERAQEIVDSIPPDKRQYYGLQRYE